MRASSPCPDKPPAGWGEKELRMYFYEHKNGTVHSKPDRVMEMADGPFVYFESSFVKRWWYEPDGSDERKPES